MELDLEWIKTLLEAIKIIVIPVIVFVYAEYKKLHGKISAAEDTIAKHGQRIDFLDEDRKIQNEQLEALRILTTTVAKLDGKIDVMLKKW